ncbi:MAG: Sec-independent protein translocase subunit TatA/TatB, partial [Acidimicrobiales bacterium]
MFSLSPIKILVIVAVVLVLLGPDKLPEVAHRLGQWWRALKRIQERVEAEVREALPDLPSSSEIARIARSPVNLLNQLADRAEAREADDAAPATTTPTKESPPPTPDSEALIEPEPP